MNQDFEQSDGKLDSREIAKRMGIKHDLLMRTLKRYRNQLGKSGRIKEYTTEDNNGSSGQVTQREVQ